MSKEKLEKIFQKKHMCHTLPLAVLLTSHGGEWTLTSIKPAREALANHCRIGSKSQVSAFNALIVF